MFSYQNSDDLKDRDQCWSGAVENALTICMEIQKTLNSQSNLEKERTPLKLTVATYKAAVINTPYEILKQRNRFNFISEIKY